MKIAILLAALLAVSPVYAAKKPAAPASTEKCVKLDEVEKQLSPGKKVEFKLVGDDLKKLKAYVKSRGGNAPDDSDGLLILSKPDSPVWMAFQSTNGCVDGAFPLDPESFKKLLAGSKGESI